MLNVLNCNGSIENFNKTFIYLIPKIKNASEMNFRPISLCNIVYKIIAKVLANRLKGILANSISINQSAFISNRLISDNVIVAFETLNHLKN